MAYERDEIVEVETITTIGFAGPSNRQLLVIGAVFLALVVVLAAVQNAWYVVDGHARPGAKVAVTCGR